MGGPSPRLAPRPSPQTVRPAPCQPALAPLQTCSLQRWDPCAPKSTRAQARRGPPAAGPPAVILGIETSCDDTGAAVVTSDGRVLGDAMASQLEIHAPWGGVVPKLAMRAHADNIDRVVDEALQE